MRFVHCSAEADNTAFSTEKFVPVRNRLTGLNNKPKAGTGLWASPVDARYNWAAWTEDWGGYVHPSSFEFSVRPDRLLRIMRVKDTRKLPTFTGEFYNDPCLGIDWEACSTEYSAVFVSDPAIDTDLFRCWDVPSLLVISPDAVEI